MAKTNTADLLFSRATFKTGR